MPGNAARMPNQPASGPALGSILIGVMGMTPSEGWINGPEYRDTLTPTHSRSTRFDPMDGTEPPDAPSMIPSPLGRGLPSRHGFGKSY